MPNFQYIMMLKNKLTDSKNVYDSILKRHNSVFNQKHQHILFNNGKFDAIAFIRMLSPVIFSGLSLYFSFNHYFFLFSFISCVMAIAMGYFNIKYIFENDKENNILIHDDYKDLATIFSKEEIKALTSYHEDIFYQDKNNKDKTYKFNLIDLFTPIENSISLEESKDLNQYKFDQYLDSIYEEDNNSLVEEKR